MDGRRRRALLERTLRELTVLHHGTRRIDVHQRERHGDELGSGHLSAGQRTTNASQDVLGDVLGHTHLRLRDTVGSRHRVLEELDDRGVGAGRDDLANHTRELTELRGCRNALRDVHVHLVTVEVGILRAGCGDVETERRVGKDTHAVSLHRSLVKRRLAVEEHDVAVDEVAVDDVALAELDALGVNLAKIHGAIFGSELDGLGTRMLVGTIAHVLHEALAILESHTFRERQVGSDLRRHAELVEINVGIRRNHRASREVHALAHEVTTDTTLLRAHAGLEGTQGTTRALDGRIESLDVVVHLGRHILLKEHRALRENVRGLALVHLVAEAVVGADDHEELVREIVLHPLIVVHDHGGTDAERRDRKDRADHPVRASEFWILPELTALLVGQALEGTQNDLRLEGNRFALLALTLKGTRRAIDLDDVLEDLGLALGTEAGLGANLGILRADRAAVQTDLVGEFVNHVEELDEVDRASHANVSEMPRALQIRVAARRADLSILGGTKARIKDAAGDGLIALVVLIRCDLDDTLLDDVVGAPDAELDANDLVAHLVGLLFLSFRRFVFAAYDWTDGCPSKFERTPRPPKRA